MFKEKPNLYLTEQIGKFLAKGREWIDQQRLCVSDFTDYDRDRLVLTGSLTGLGIGLGADLLSPLVTASVRHGLVFAGADVWQKIQSHPVETVLATTSVGIIGSTFISLTAKSVEGPPIDPSHLTSRKK